jgi:hypothetical protein
VPLHSVSNSKSVAGPRADSADAIRRWKNRLALRRGCVALGKQTLTSEQLSLCISQT